MWFVSFFVLRFVALNELLFHDLFALIKVHLLNLIATLFDKLPITDILPSVLVSLANSTNVICFAFANNSLVKNMASLHTD